MKLLASASGLFVFIVLLFSAQTNLSSCQKQIIRDTIKDTITIRDTVVVIDSLSCNCYDLKDGLIAHYDFMNGSLNDLSGNNNNIVFNNAVKTTDRFSKADNAYLFNGTSSYMRIANSASLNSPTSAITIMAIVNVKSFYMGNCGGNLIVGKGAPDDIDGQYLLRVKFQGGCNTTVDPAKELFQGAYGNLSTKADATDVSFVSPNKWYNVIFTYENGVSKIYVDGKLTFSKTGPQTLFTTNSQDMFIGKHDNLASPYPFGGIIDEVRVYNRAVCQGEVNQLNKLQN